MRGDNSYEVRRAGPKRDGLARNETITLPYPVHGAKPPARRPARRLYRRRASHHTQRDGGAGRRDQCLRRAGAGPADRPLHEPGLLPSIRHESRLPRRERARTLVASHPGRRRTHRWAVGTVRIGEDPGPRHSGSDGGNPHRPQMDPPVPPPTAAVGPVVTYPDELLETAMRKLLEHEVDVLPVASPEDPARVVGYVERSAILGAWVQLTRDERSE